MSPRVPLPLRPLLPLVRGWIAHTLNATQHRARPLDSVERAALAGYFAEPTLARARLVIGAPLPAPPVPTLGISRLAQFKSGSYAGLTLHETIFVAPEHANDVGLLAHELVHVLQWLRLGPRGFVERYAAELLAYGYGQSPLEKMAYAHESRFRHAERYDLETEVHRALDGDAGWP